MNKILKLIWYGFVVWLVPFLAGFLFYTREGVLLIDIFLFKSIMIVLGALVGVCFFVRYFRSLKRDFVYEGVIAGLVFFAVNIVLDLIVLIPMSGIGVGAYFAQVGLRYLIMPIMSVGMGYSARRK